MQNFQHDLHDNIQFLQAEYQFLDEVETCLSLLSRQSIGSRFTDETLDHLESLQRSANQRNNARLAFRERMVASRTAHDQPVKLKLFADETGAESAVELRDRVRRRTLDLRSQLRAVLMQLTESQVVVTTVLEAVLGVAQSEDRYDSSGRLVKSTMTIPMRRVA